MLDVFREVRTVLRLDRGLVWGEWMGSKMGVGVVGSSVSAIAEGWEDIVDVDVLGSVLFARTGTVSCACLRGRGARERPRSRLLSSILASGMPTVCLFPKFGYWTPASIYFTQTPKNHVCYLR